MLTGGMTLLGRTQPRLLQWRCYTSRPLGSSGRLQHRRVMEEGEQIRREVWEGKIPVCFSVDEREMSINIASPEPCFMMISRVSYLPVMFEWLERLYAKGMDASVDDRLWLSSGSIPLKWHYPVGILYDLYGRGCSLPWQITVHFKGYPEEELLQYCGKESLEAHFKSKIKEADCLKHRSEVIQGLTPQEFEQMWNSVQHVSFDKFWAVNKKLMLNMKGESTPFQHIPFCAYRFGRKVYMRLISSVDEKGQPNTLQQLVSAYCTDSESKENSVAAVIHGVEVPLATPLQWLCEHLCYPDNFVHLCLVDRT